MWPLVYPTGVVDVAERPVELSSLDDESLAIDALTLDRVVLGEQRPESDHDFAGTATEAGQSDGSHWRTTSKQFTVRMTNAQGAARYSRMSRVGSSASHAFDVFMGGSVVGSVEDAGRTETAGIRDDSRPCGFCQPMETNRRRRFL
jgi:hypothetical protein